MCCCVLGSCMVMVCVVITVFLLLFLLLLCIVVCVVACGSLRFCLYRVVVCFVLECICLRVLFLCVL